MSTTARQDNQASSSTDQLHELVTRHRINDPAGDIAHHFAMADTVKTIYVNRRQHRELVSGVLGIVVLDYRHHLVPAAIARRIRAMDPLASVIVAKPDGENDGVPDDLVW